MQRNNKLEDQLNAVLKGGNCIWVIGDIHGHNLTLQELLSQIKLAKEDKVIFVGDLIDSGPRSAQVIETVRSDSRFHSILGNHEKMMIESMKDLDSGRPGMTTTTWLMKMVMKNCVKSVNGSQVYHLKSSWMSIVLCTLVMTLLLKWIPKKKMQCSGLENNSLTIPKHSMQKNKSSSGTHQLKKYPI